MQAPRILHALGPGDRFCLTRHIYTTAVKSGLINAHISNALSGDRGPCVDAEILTEKRSAIEISASLTILGIGLGLIPLIIAGTRELQQNI